MSEPFIAEIKIFAGNFAPRGWAFCNGQLLPISQNTALFSLIGTIYGGDGRTTTALPNLQGRAPMHPGNGPGLSNRNLGQKGGVETVTLTENQMPAHDHNFRATTSPATSHTPTTTASLARSSGGFAYNTETPDQPLNEDALNETGGTQPHNNLQPFMTLNYIIALVGIYPTRN